MGSVLEILFQKPDVTEAREEEVWGQKEIEKESHNPWLGRPRRPLPPNRLANSPLISYGLLQLCQQWILFPGHNGHIHIVALLLTPYTARMKQKGRGEALHLPVGFLIF